ncbi:MAG: flagellar FlbD family protein [Dehalococcoidia bacterium]|nr:flagellar FlbD family protein [Dehalococcoidia bacterium]
MVQLSRFDSSEFYLNADLIETIETTPDTVISLTSGKKLIVRESAEEVVSRVVSFRRRIIGIVASPER